MKKRILILSTETNPGNNWVRRRYLGEPKKSEKFFSQANVKEVPKILRSPNAENNNNS